MAQHEKAIPKNEILRKRYSVITAEEVQFCYQHKLLTTDDKKDFECITVDCSAPLTCQNMTKKERTAFFIDGKRSINLHTSHCPFSEEQLRRENANLSKEQEAIYKPSGLTVLDTRGGQFSKGLELPTNKEKRSSSFSKGENDPSDVGKNKLHTAPFMSKEALPKKMRNKHLTSIGKVVVEYEENPEFIINKGFIGLNVPLQRYFSPIKNNHLPVKFYDDIPIYYGTGYARLSKKGYYTFSFSEAILLDGHYYQPHFFIKQEFIDYFFPFVHDYVTNKKVTFNIYIQSRFWFGKSKEQEPVLRFQERGEKLLPLVYFTERK